MSLIKTVTYVCLYLLGFYTEWLMYAAFVGCIVMLYGFSTIPTHRNAIA